MLQEIAVATIPGVILAVVGYILGLRQNKANARSSEIDNENKAAAFYQNLLDDAARRLNVAIEAIKERDDRIAELISEIEKLTDELRKYKQLNGKT